ncbi:MAG: biopolymer transporter ExbD [Pirellulales bacterium]|nr:biopolymer transporter ExbD [Pirellulales bacterium]
MRFSSRDHTAEQTKSSLTSFVDIVFLLLVFFVLTFQVVPSEGDFEVEFSRGGVAESNLSTIRVEIRPSARADGEPTITWYDGLGKATPVDDMRSLNRLAWKDRDGGSCLLPPCADVILDVDPSLDYRHTVDALSALSARHVDGERRKIFRAIALARAR